MSTQPVVRMQTSAGQIVIELNAEQAPLTVKNFLDYVRDDFYQDTIFHRVIPGFMIQGGGFTAEMSQKKTSRPIRNEADNGLTNQRCTLAMARTQVVDSATSQFFINLADNDFLNHQDRSASGFGYAVFGRVIEGMDVVDTIAGVTTGPHGPHQDVPRQAVLIESLTIDD